MNLLDLLMREDLTKIHEPLWRNGPRPPKSLLSYISEVRRHSLSRDFAPIDPTSDHARMTRNVALGMKVKKVHEVDHFSRYVEKLTSDLSSSTAATKRKPITHLVDFGSGQGYLPRCLASPPYDRHLVAIESKVHNIEGARNWDVMAKLAEKPVIMRNKKQFRIDQMELKANGRLQPERKASPSPKGERGFFYHPGAPEGMHGPSEAVVQVSSVGQGSVQYVEHWISNGDLSRVVGQIVDPEAIHQQSQREATNGAAESEQAFTSGHLRIQENNKSRDPSLMIISLHSCGNLVHHGIRSLLLNPAVSAVALVGCCYNLLTEKLGPPTHKLPSMRSSNERLDTTSQAHDPHGFPMSERLCNLHTRTGKGLRLNITARMMAVQAPQNWGKTDSESFFTRHFFRALLQRIFLDLGLVDQAGPDDDTVGDSSPLGWSGGTKPIIIGSLRKSCYDNFVTYVRGVAAKLVTEPERGELFQEKLGGLTDKDILDYEEKYGEQKKDLSMLWSLMAFSAGVVEATIVVDRWLFLKEQEEVAHAWVEPVFDYKQSPRNLVVVGIKR